MARGRQKEELTLEEKLERALVPVEEQPYEVPGNWCWVIFDYIASIKRGASPRPIKEYITEKEGVNWIKIGDSDSGKYINNVKERITSEGANKSVYVKSGSLLLSNSMSFGHPYILNIDGCIHDGWLAITPLKVIDKDFLYYALLASDWYFEQVAVGTAVRNLNSKRVASLPIAIPPLAEQQRIVEQIESLFAKLDEVKEKILDVVQLSEIRRLALINHAFTGELVGITDAYSISLLDIVEEIKIGPFGSSLHKEDYIMDGIPVINPKHINNQKINPNKEVSITSEKARELSSYVLKANDIIMGRRGEMGRTAPVSKKEEGYICGTGSLIIRLKKGFRADLYSQILGSQSVINYLEQNCVGSTMKNLNEKIVKQIPIPYFTKEQQDKLMIRFETMLVDEKQILDDLGGIVDAISLIKKSILAKAFRGKLGTNNLEEQPAIEALKTIFMAL